MTRSASAPVTVWTAPMLTVPVVKSLSAFRSVAAAVLSCTFSTSSPRPLNPEDA